MNEKESESCCAFCKNNVSLLYVSDIVIQRDVNVRIPQQNYSLSLSLSLCVCVYIYNINLCVSLF